MKRAENELLDLAAAVVKLRGLMRDLFGPAASSVGLSLLEATVLGTVVHVEQPLTVSQIGRYLGNPRQAVQRAAGRLVELEFVEYGDNPDHKRAPLIYITEKGREANRKNHDQAVEISANVLALLDRKRCHALADELMTVIKVFEQVKRSGS